MLRTTKLVILAALLGLVLAPAASAQLLVPHGSLGPVNPLNGFPTYVTDINNVSLDLPTPPYGDGVTAPTMIYDPVIALNDLSIASGFGAEAFFYLAESTVDLANGGKALLVLGIEAAYGAGEPDPTSPPDQFLFARVRVRFDAAAAGTYTVTHPWGVEKLEVTAADVGSRFSYTNDWGGFAPIPNADLLQPPLVPSSFERILYSPKQWRFLIADIINVSATLIPGSDEAILQRTYMVGDGVTPSTVTGGLGGVNTFTIEGPADDTGNGPIVATSTQFTVSGHIAGQPRPTAGTIQQPGEQDADTVTITRARLRGAQVEVRATSSNGFPMTAELYNGGVGGTLVGSGNLGTNGRGNINFTGPAPDTVRVHSTSTDPAFLGGAAIAQVTN
jgi:hypothetical protein